VGPLTRPGDLVRLTDGLVIYLDGRTGWVPRHGWLGLVLGEGTSYVTFLVSGHIMMASSVGASRPRVEVL